MITKQQALEFLYELSKKHEVCLDLKHGILGLNPFCDGDEIPDYEYSVNVHSCILTDIVKEFILKYPEIANEIKLVPVDINMLEIGSKYTVYYNEAVTTNIFRGIENNKIKFDATYPFDINGLKEIYKVND